MSERAPKAAIYTLGCRLNQADSAHLTDDLQGHGYQVVPWNADADVVIINSCTVTANAAHKTRKTARAVRRRLPHAWIIVVGCDVEVAADSWLQEEAVDLLIGNADKGRLCDWLTSLSRRRRGPVLQRSRSADKGEGFRESGVAQFPERTRAHLKIQEGCDYRCSYCIVPTARGPARSRDWEDILREARHLVSANYREMVLTGVNIAAYEREGRDLADLLEALLDIPGRFRIRLSSTEPGDGLERVIEVMASNPAVCRFLHLPMQYGEDSVLRAMNRRYRVASFEHLARMAAARVPEICLGSDIIVGFPGETSSAFEACCETVERLPLSHLHVFTFSPREGTPAASFSPRVAGDVAAERARILSRIGREKGMRFAASHVGTQAEIITETRNDRGQWEGWTDNYLRVRIVNDGTLRENEWAAVRITDALDGRHVSAVSVGDDRGERNSLRDAAGSAYHCRGCMDSNGQRPVRTP